jgi:hypothetical protein
MRGYFGLGQLSAEEKSDILDKHRHVYNGYRTMQPEVSNQQPLYVHDFAGDKEGMVVNNKGEVKKYTNMGINEQVESKDMCEQCGGRMDEGICEQCGTDGKMEEGVGKLDDIYDEEDLDPTAGFDYIEGPSNDVDTFEGSHKNLYKEQSDDDFVDYDGDEASTWPGVNYGDYDPDNEDDGYEDMNASEVTDEIEEEDSDEKPYEKGKLGMKASRTRATFEPTPKEKDILEKLFGEYGNDIPPIVIRYLRKLPRKVLTKRLMDLNLINTEMLNNKESVTEQGGNTDDMNVGDVAPAYDFDSDGPMAGGDVYPVNELDFEDEDPNTADYEPMTEDDMYAYEPEMMESAWAEEMDEVDVSGSQGIYGAMEKAYDFDSDGPGKGGPYQEFSYESVEEEIEEVDKDLQESFKAQKNKIMEMFNRVNKYN